MIFNPGVVLGDHYRIIQEIGAGGMGIVFKAMDTLLNRYVAIKVLTGAVDRDQRNRFLTEARATAAISHPNITTIYAIGEVESIPFIVLEFIEGIDLRSRIEKGPLQTDQCLKILIQIGTGLQASHRGGIIHRDVKPANILLNAKGEAKLTDFGLATIQEAIALTRPGERLGTILYMSPEQARGATVDQRTDIWSLGVVLYECLTGHRPFNGPHSAAVLFSILNDEPPPVTLLRRDLPDRMNDIIRRSLSKDLRGRYQNMDQMLTDLIDLEKELANRQTAPRLRATSSSAGSRPLEATVKIPSTIPSSAERRQLTVIYCYITVSTVAREAIDPEDLETVIAGYRRISTEIIGRFEGNVINTFGESLIAYFGYPNAHEDDPVRAVHAGLKMGEDMNRLALKLHAEQGFEMDFRIGIHTGLALVKNPASTTDGLSVISDIQTVATRIAGLAKPNALLISYATLRLVKGFFQCRRVSKSSGVAGGKSAGAIYEVLKSNSAITRLDAAPARDWTPLIGREREVDVLWGCWRRFEKEQGQVVVTRGEAGIGKSRLVRLLRDHVATMPEFSLAKLQCSPYHQNTAFFPFTSWLERVLFRFDRQDSMDQKQAKLQAALAAYGFDLAEAVPLFCSLLSIPAEADQLHEVNPRRQKQKTFQALMTIWREISKKTPVLLLIEDLHWSDPSSLELIDLMVNQFSRERIFVLLTCRPEFSVSWMMRSHVTSITLSRLTDRDSEAMIAHVAKGLRLPDKVLRFIVSRCDGVPLFIEEMTKALLESDILTEWNNTEQVSTLSTTLIPSSLRDSLSARLDRLSDCKETVQLASVLGREFPFEWLLAVCGLHEEKLLQQIERLQGAELFFQEGVLPNAMLMFKHALIQEAAYESVPKPIRSDHHRRIAEILPTLFPETVGRHPEYLAHHCSQAGLTDRAAYYWTRAGQAAVERSANLEAITHYRQAIEIFSGIPVTQERIQKQLDLLVALGGPLLAVRGYASPEVGEIFIEADRLCREIGDSPRTFEAVQGLWAYFLVRGQLDAARSLAERLVQISTEQASFELEAFLRLGITCSMLGQPVSAFEHFQRVLSLYDPEKHRTNVHLYGQDPLVSCYCHLAVVLWLLGFPDQALTKSDDAIRIAKEIRHPFSLSWALLYSAIIHTMRRETQASNARAAELADLSAKQAFAYRLAQARILKAWSISKDQPSADTAAEVRKGIQEVMATGAEVYLPYYLALATESSNALNDYPEGLRTIAHALEIIAKTGERFYEAELYRLRGETLLAGQFSTPEAEASFLKALEISQRQQSKSLELRAATSLVRLRLSKGDTRETQQMLAQLLSDFREGYESSDYLQAKLLLNSPW